MLLFYLFLALVHLKKQDFAFPAEFQCEHKAIFLAWPSFGREEYAKGYHVEDAQGEIISALTSIDIPVNLLVEHQLEKTKVKEILSEKGIDLSKVTFFEIEHIDIWMRDYGPIFVLSRESKEKIAIFGFNDYGYDLEQKTNKSIVDSKLSEKVASQLSLPLHTHSPLIVSEGGDRSINKAFGTMLVTSAVEAHRNPTLERGVLENAYKALLGVENVVWLAQGVLEDDLSSRGRVFDGQEWLFLSGGTGGHNDEYCRFVSEDTILLSMVTDEEFSQTDNLLVKENYVRMLENYEILLAETAFKIVNFTTPKLMYHTLHPGDVAYEDLAQIHFDDGTTFPYGQPVRIVLPCSYMNFLVTNDLVLMPYFYHDGMDKEIKKRDDEAKEIIQDLFPERKVVQIDILPVVLGGGGIHCITQQQPVEDCLVV